MKLTYKILVFIVLNLSLFYCNRLYLDPNSTLEPDVISNSDNLIRLINGIQQHWSSKREGIIYTCVNITGLNTGELQVLNPGNTGENEILLGGDNIGGDNELLNNMWTNAMLCRKEASTVINSANTAAKKDTSLANTLKAYGLFYRALVHGTLIQYFEKIPIEIIENASFSDREAVLENVIDDLTEAKSYVNKNLSSTDSKLIGSIDLKNSINALLARFNLMAGNYDEAITAADQVDLSIKSVWAFDKAIPNPLAFWFGSKNVTQAKDAKFALPNSIPLEKGDKRVEFYVFSDNPQANIPVYEVKAFFDDNLDSVPVYLPGEMILIKAEAYARKNDLVNAIKQINIIRNKTSVDDAFGIGASLGDYSGALNIQSILNEIYRNRRIELYLSGLGLEDSRRFGRSGEERNRDYYPYPNSERDNNKNTPPNPRF